MNGFRRDQFYMMSSTTLPAKSKFNGDLEIKGVVMKHNKLLRAKVDQRFNKTQLQEMQKQVQDISGLHLLNLYPTALTDSFKIDEQNIVGRVRRLVGSGSKVLVEFSVLNSFIGEHVYGFTKVNDRWYMHLI